jgi:hypothetical protein
MSGVETVNDELAALAADHKPIVRISAFGRVCPIVLLPILTSWHPERSDWSGEITPFEAGPSGRRITKRNAGARQRRRKRVPSAGVGRAGNISFVRDEA